MGSYEIKSIADINGDKVKDICISCNGGGNAVSWSEIDEYKDKEYSMLIAIQQDDSPLEEVNTNLSIDEKLNISVNSKKCGCGISVYICRLVTELTV